MTIRRAVRWRVNTLVVLAGLLAQVMVVHASAGAAGGGDLLGEATAGGRPAVGVATPGADVQIGGDLLDDGTTRRGQLVHDTGFDGTDWAWADDRDPDVAPWSEGHGDIVFQKYGYLGSWPVPLDPTTGSQSVRWVFDTVGAYYSAWRWADTGSIKRCHNGLGDTVYPTSYAKYDEHYEESVPRLPDGALVTGWTATHRYTCPSTHPYLHRFRVGHGAYSDRHVEWRSDGSVGVPRRLVSQATCEHEDQTSTTVSQSSMVYDREADTPDIPAVGCPDGARLVSLTVSRQSIDDSLSDRTLLTWDGTRLVGIGGFDGWFSDELQARWGLLAPPTLGEGTLRALRSVPAYKLEEALLFANCPSTNPSSLNDCQWLFASLVAGGMAAATAFAIVYSQHPDETHDLLEDVIGVDPAPSDPTPFPVPPPVFDPIDINQPIPVASWHDTAEHDELVEHYTRVAYYSAIDADWLADVACQNAIDTGDERDYPAWYGCVQLRLLRVTNPGLTLPELFSLLVTQFDSRDAAELGIDDVIEDGLVEQEPVQDDFGIEPVTDNSRYPGGTNDPCDEESVLPIEYRTAEGQVDIDTSDMTPEEVEQTIKHARMLNSYIARFGPTVPQRTTGTVEGKALGSAARIARNVEARRAEDAGDPYGPDYVVGHGPDASFANRPDSPCGWERLTALVNARFGGHWGSRVLSGVPVTHVTVDGVVPGELLPVSYLPSLP